MLLETVLTGVMIARGVSEIVDRGGSTGSNCAPVALAASGAVPMHVNAAGVYVAPRSAQYSISAAALRPPTTSPHRCSSSTSPRS